MDLLQAVKERHSVRQYIDKPIETEKSEALLACIDECNRDGKLNFQLVLNEPKAFNSFMARYGKFSGVQNYVVLVARKGENVEELVGYYGAKILLFAQTLGLNTCWVAMTYKKVKTAFVVEKGEKVYGAIAIGYGKTQGVSHKIKSISDVCESKIEETPVWFVDGVKTALLAPTAMNQQKFYFTLNSDESVTATTKGGFYTKTDLGIAKYFFEVGTNETSVKWKIRNI